MIAVLDADYAQPLRDADASADIAGLRRIAHKLYGCAGSFGLLDLADAARALELHLIACNDRPAETVTMRALLAGVLHQCERLAPTSSAPTTV